MRIQHTLINIAFSLDTIRCDALRCVNTFRRLIISQRVTLLAVNEWNSRDEWLQINYVQLTGRH